MFVLILRNAASSLQKAGGIYSLVALSPSVGAYASGRFRSNVPMRVVQPTTQTNNSVDLETPDHCQPTWDQAGSGTTQAKETSSSTVFNNVVRIYSRSLGREDACKRLLEGATVRR
jgi:hypothetical protein